MENSRPVLGLGRYGWFISCELVTKMVNRDSVPLLARLHSYLFIGINWPSKVKSEVGIGASVLSASASDRGPGDDLRVDVE